MYIILDKFFQFIIITKLIGGRKAIFLPKVSDTVPYNKLIGQTLTAARQQMRS